MYVKVVLNIPADKCFTYDVPHTMEHRVQIGKRVFVPFGRRKRTGFIIGTETASDRDDVKAISQVLDEEALFDESDLVFYRWISDYYIYPLGKTLAELIPSGAEKKDYRWITLAQVAHDMPADLSRSACALLDYLRQHPKGIAVDRLMRHPDLKNVPANIQILYLAGRIHIEEKQTAHLHSLTEKYIQLKGEPDPRARLTPKQTAVINALRASGPVLKSDLILQAGVTDAVIKRLVDQGIVDVLDREKKRKVEMNASADLAYGPIRLNLEQKKAIEDLTAQMDRQIFSSVLLRGVTGSGKTEVYLNAIDHALQTGQTAIYLVPEIALTPQLISRIAGRFDPDKIAVIHSGIPEPVRYDQWRRMRSGEITLVIGARSALFAPLPNLRLIIVDEEHDASYKQDERLCYHARDLAVVKASMSQAVVVLGSATPGLRTFFNAQSRKYGYMELTCRVNDRPMPRIDIVDMKNEKMSNGKTPVLSDSLARALAQTLDKKKQSLLFLNKRGFDTFLVCADCGYNFRCPNCAVSLKNHAAEGLIKCHYCDHTQRSMPLCPSCRGGRILNYGTGTQKLEAEIMRLFPAARVQRMDSDSTGQKGQQESILKALARREIDILVGTQMITKGHDFPHITLVGVISADTSLNMPDFRAAEKTFQILTQVAGRGGRGESPGHVVIQSFNPHHYALCHAQNHDYYGFYTDEIEFRKALHYPPYGHLINIRMSSPQKEALLQTVKELGSQAHTLLSRHSKTAQIIGPAEAPLARIRGHHRYHMLLKGDDMKVLRRVARELLMAHNTSSVKVTLDVDPEHFM